MLLPIPLLPEPKPFRTLVAIAEGGVGIGRARLELDVPEFFDVGAHDLVCIDENHAAHAQREEHVQEEDLREGDREGSRVSIDTSNAQDADETDR